MLCGGLDQPVGIRYALGDPLGGDQVADWVMSDQLGEFFCTKMGVNGQVLFQQLARKLEDHLFFRSGNGAFGDVAYLRDAIDNFADQHFRRRGACG